jgi:molybdate transport system regulatory protein
MRAWTLIRTVNRCFNAPLVEAVRGGAHGGEARLTPAGHEVLALYREIATVGLLSTLTPWRKLRRHLRA